MIKINVYGIRGFPDVQGCVEKHCEELYTRMNPNAVRFKVFRRKPYLNNQDDDTNNTDKNADREHKDKKYKNIQFRDTWTIKNKYLETIVHSFLSAFETIRDRPDVVHIHNMGPAVTLPLIKLFGLKSVVTLHSINYKHSKWNWFSRLMLKFSEKLVFIFADKVIFVSDSYMQCSIKNSGLKESKAIKIPNGLTSFNDLTSSIPISGYGLKSDKYVLYVGRIVPEKRLQDLILAFSKIETSMKLVIVGSYDNTAKYFEELYKFKSKLGQRLIFTGFLNSNNIKPLYQNAFCFVLPSESEGMPIVLLETMSFGKCPLVSNIAENLDVTKNHGFSFEVCNVCDLRNKLEYMLNNKSIVKKKGLECKRLVKNDYDWNVIAKKTLQVYKDVLHG